MQHAYEQMKQEREENQQKKDLANINYWTNIAKGFVSPAK